MDITSALETATSLFTWTTDTISSNPILTACFVVGTLVPIGISAVFVKFKHAVS